jgi:hypothetical protein
MKVDDNAVRQRISQVNAVPSNHTNDKRQEYKAITDERRSSLQTLRKAGFDVTKVDEKEHCPWGLEPLQSAQHMKLFKARHRSIVQAVLAEQKFQRIVSRPDPECLRLISTSFSRVSLESALERAAQDARKVKPSVLVETSVATPDHHVLPAVRGTESLPSNSPRRKRPRIVSLQA